MITYTLDFFKAASLSQFSNPVFVNESKKSILRQMEERFGAVPYNTAWFTKMQTVIGAYFYNENHLYNLFLRKMPTGYIQLQMSVH